MEYIIGDITKPYALQKFFEQAEGKEAVLIHCAGLVSVASKEEQIWSVNVDGTRNIVDLCEKYSISKLLYVSSVHAIEERKNRQLICETKQFSASRVKGIYAKSKAEATAYVQKAGFGEKNDNGFLCMGKRFYTSCRAAFKAWHG